MQIDHLKSERTIERHSGVNYNRLSAFSASTRMHDHDFCEFFFIRQGEILHKINGRSKVVRGGQLVFIRPNDVHSFANTGSECVMYNLAFRNQLLVKCANFAENSISLENFYNPEFPPVFDLNENEQIRLIGDLETAGGHLSNNPTMAKNRFFILVLEVFSRNFYRQQSSGSVIPEWFEELCTKMREKRNFIAGLTQMQELAYCSSEHLCRCCQKYLSQSPTEFINELRINFAASQLIYSDDKIYAIAINSGFPNLSHFYHQFKKIYQISPAAYRKQQQQIVV